MGIVKRLDDMKRIIERMRRELDELKAAAPFGSTKGSRPEKIGELVETLETAFTMNKRLAESVIKIRERLYEIAQDNKKLRADIEAVKSRGFTTRVQHGRQPHAALGILKAVEAGPRSSTEISQMVGRSREHTSRTVRELVNVGLLEATTSRYPAKYILTEAGRETLKSDTRSTSG